MPPRPIVVDIATPNVDPMRDIFLFEDALELEGIRKHFILPGTLPGADDDPTLAILIDVPGIGQVREIGKGRIEIDILVHVIADEMMELEQPADGNDRIENIRVAKEEVRSMIRAHTDARSDEFCRGIPAMLSHEWSHLLDDVAIIVLVTPGSIRGMRPAVRPGLAVDAIHRKELDLACFDK